MFMIAPENFDPAIGQMEHAVSELWQATGYDPICAGVVYSPEQVSVLLQENSGGYYLPTRKIERDTEISAAFGALLLDDIGLRREDIRYVFGLPDAEYDAAIASEEEGRQKRYLPMVAIVYGQPETRTDNVQWYPFEEVPGLVGRDNTHSQVIARISGTIVDWHLTQ